MPGFDNLQLPGAAHSNNNLLAYATKKNFVFSASIATFARTVSDKQYELKDHLGNVRATVSDIKHPVYSTGSPVVLLGFTADLRSVMNYYSFGMEMPGRCKNAEYRFGFNGMEKDDELKGSGNSYDFGARMYDSRVGRWMSIDGKSKEHQSNYVFTANSPIIFVDPDGNDDYYYDRRTNSYVVVRTGAPHRFYTTTDPYPVDGGGYVQSYRIANDSEIGNMLISRPAMCRDALENAKSRQEQENIFMSAFDNRRSDDWQVAFVTCAVPVALIASIFSTVAAAPMATQGIAMIGTNANSLYGKAVYHAVSNPKNIGKALEFTTSFLVDEVVILPYSSGSFIASGLGTITRQIYNDFDVSVKPPAYSLHDDVQNREFAPAASTYVAPKSNVDETQVFKALD